MMRRSPTGKRPCGIVIGPCGTPTITAVPPWEAPTRPGRATSTIWRSVTSAPIASKVKSTPPPVMSFTASTGSTSEALTTSVAPNSPREVELVVAEIDGDDAAGTGDLGAGEDVDANTADAEHRHGVALLDLRGAEDGTDAGDRRAAHDRGVLDRDVVGQRQHHLLVGKDVLGPGVDAGSFVIATAEAEASHGDLGILGRDVAGDPGDHDAVALADVGDGAAGGDHHPGGFMAEEERTGERGVVHLVELGMADARREELDEHLFGARIGQLDLLDRELLSVLNIDGGAGLHAGSSFVRWSGPAPTIHLTPSPRSWCARATIREEARRV